MRPLTLLNTFYKVISSVLAARLKVVLSRVANVPGRYIGEVTRSTYDLFHHAKHKYKPGTGL